MKRVQEYLEEYGRQCLSRPDEAKIKATVQRSREVFFEEAERLPATYVDFFWQQAGYIEKRWWVLQLLTLTVLWWYIRDLSRRTNLQSVMGIMAAVFAIMLIPELWKNKTAKAMEIEGSTFYSLRQIYAVRMLAFGMVDVGLLSVFTVITSVTTSVQVEEMIIYFFLPFTVACGIMFRALCSRYMASQTGAVIASLFWVVVWLLVVTNERIYPKISVPVWAMLFLMAVLFLGHGVKKALTTCESYWEVSM